MSDLKRKREEFGHWKLDGFEFNGGWMVSAIDTRSKMVRAIEQAETFEQAASELKTRINDGRTKK